MVFSTSQICEALKIPDEWSPAFVQKFSFVILDLYGNNNNTFP